MKFMDDNPVMITIIEVQSWCHSICNIEGISVGHKHAFHGPCVPDGP